MKTVRAKIKQEAQGQAESPPEAVAEVSSEEPEDRRPGKAARKKKRGRKRRFGLWLLLSLSLQLVIGAVLFLRLTGMQIEAPEWLRARVEAKINQTLPAGHVGIGKISFQIGDDWAPGINLQNLAFVDQGNRPLVRIEQAHTSLSLSSMLKGRILARTLSLSRAELSLRRAPNGKLDLSLGAADSSFAAAGSLSDVLESVDRMFELPALATIDVIQANSLTLNFEDARVGRNWLLTDGRLLMEQNAQSVDISLALKIGNAELSETEKTGALPQTTAEAEFSFKTQKGSRVASFGASVAGVDARDIATQVPALAWLSVVDAPISGAFRAGIGETGLLSKMDATLQIGAGAINPAEGAKPVKFTSGKAYLSFDPAAQKIRFEEFSLQTDILSLSAEGTAYLRDIEDGLPQTLLGQFKLSEAHFESADLLESPLDFSGGAADLRLRLNPLTLDIGQAVLEDGERRFSASGKVSAGENGWSLALDMEVNQITAPALLKLWPVAMVPKTREWIRDNVLAGEITDAKGAIRLNPGEAPIFSVGYDFADISTRFMKKMPPVQGASGYATIADNAFTVVMEEGFVTAPNGETINGSGTVFHIPDIREKPASAVITLRSESSVPAALALLDNPPFEFLSKAGQPVDLATGKAKVEGEIRLPLVLKVPTEDVFFDLTAHLSDVRSDKLVPGRVLSAPKLTVNANQAMIEISGAGKLGLVPVKGRWVQKLDPQFKGRSTVEGTVELSQRFIDEFRIGLPKGSVKGAGTGHIKIALARGQASRFQLSSNLVNLQLGLVDLGWRKPARTKGSLKVSGRLGTPPVIENLAINAAGLTATGAISLTSSGALKTARFKRVKVGGWLDAPVTLTGRGKGASPAITVSGGMIDLRKTSFGRAGGTGSGGPLTLNLDRLIVSEGITLTSLRGKFSSRPAFNGSFTARVNRGTAISGTLAPDKGGTAIRIRSKDAGGVFRSADVLDKVYGGSMDLILIPRKGEIGSYDGRLTVKNTRVKGASALAELLNAISVIGLLDQLNGGGISFANVEAFFRLTPNQVIITRSSAVGPSMGVSMDGYYNLGTKQLNMQGVISPFYAVNMVGRPLTRKGEGLFGFNFRIVGTSERPKVKVNPLSILTPGMFREIFRRPPPKLKN